jgi:hypothetical protein
MMIFKIDLKYLNETLVEIPTFFLSENKSSFTSHV